MSAKLGANDAAFRLGNQAVSVYLGAVEVYTPGITFTGAVDNDWAELGNWSGGALPTASDSVIATAPIFSNSGSAPTVVNITMVNSDLAIAITVTGMGTLTVTGGMNGTVTGNVTFNDETYMEGTVNGNATFNDISYNSGTVTGTATFTGSACNTTGSGTAGTFVPDPPPACA